MKKILRKRKTLGILGGMGPLADVTFLKRLHESTYACYDCEYVPVIYDGNCLRPDRSAYLSGKSKFSPFFSLRASFKALERNGAGVIAMPCNTAHFWYGRLKKLKKRSTVFIDIVKETALLCQSKGLFKVCLLSTEGTRKKDLYGEAMFRMGIDLIYPEKELANEVSALIKRIKRGEDISLEGLEAKLEDVDCDGFILGCTELSVAFERTRNPSFTYIDSLSALAVACVKACGAEQKQG
ncbi:MAG: aspartate/glutamate racemase family protein [Clostridia bacterium]|nr:aspartate/glutamate racemase family protein [Clostridia bacterium]